MLDLHTVAEERAGTPISEDEYQQALPVAQHKLEYINNLNGTHHGEPYLAILIAETVKAQRLTQYLNALYDLREQARLESLA